MRYSPQKDLSRPARPSAAPRRLIAGVLLMAASFLVLAFVYARLSQALVPASAWGEDGLGIDRATTPWGALVNLYVFAMLIASLWLTLALVHNRTLASLIGPARIALRQFGRVVLALVAFYAVLALLPYPPGMVAAPNLPLATWLAFLPLALVGLLVQTSAEELVFRGYLQSQLAARYASPAIWIGLPTLIFAALHYAPLQTGEGVWLIVLWAAAFGVVAADLTARSGTLGPAIALHFVNNGASILVAAPMGGFDGLALYTYPFTLDGGQWTWMPVDLMTLFCAWLAARLALRR